MVKTLLTDIPRSPQPPPFQVGGSLGPTVLTYVRRQADDLLCQSLLQGEFSYVLNCRQMGKSSLMVHTLQALEDRGCLCATVDITSLGTQQVTPSQWYRGIIADLWRGFRLFGRVNYQTWWQERGDLPPVQKLGRFLRDVLLEEFPQQSLVIFIDEIDSVLSLGFSLDDFFALIRFCYNQRSLDPAYQRLTFAVFGVATPSDLVKDSRRTPFNIGQAIPVDGFRFSECDPLIMGLAPAIRRPKAVVREILRWTHGQPFLTQKICAFIWHQYQQQAAAIALPHGTEAAWVDQLVRESILHNWQFQDEPEHLRTICHRLLVSPQRQGRLLGLYQQILRRGAVPPDNSAEEMELLLTGLVTKQRGLLRVKNPIYRAVFDEAWVDHHLNQLRPYAQANAVWFHSNQQDHAQLLRGQSLRDAQEWARDKRLSDADYQFLTASVEAENRAVQTVLETERAEAIAAKLAQSQRNERLQKLLLGVLGVGFVMATGLGSIAHLESRRANRNEKIARRSEIEALIASAEGWFASKNRLDAMIQAIRAHKKLSQMRDPDSALSQQVDEVLRQIIYGTHEINRFSGHQGVIKQVAYRSDGQQIATASEDNTLKLWHPDGRLQHSLAGHRQGVLSVSYAPNADLLATGGGGGTIILWNPQTGTQLTTLEAGETRILSLAFSPDGQRLAAGTVDGRVLLWNRQGTLLKTVRAHQAMVRSVAFSPKGDRLVTSSADKTIKVWHPTEGRLLNTLTGHAATVAHVAFSPDGQRLASASSDTTIKLWTRDGQLLNTLVGHQVAVTNVQFSPDGNRLVSTSLDHQTRFWTATGEPLNAYDGISAAGGAIAFSPNGKYLVSSGLEDSHDAVLWRLETPLYAVFGSHAAAVTSIDYSPTGEVLASSSSDGDIKLWQPNGELKATLQGHEAAVLELEFSPNGDMLASTSLDQTIRLWQTDGTPLLTYEGHARDAARMAFAPQGNEIASAGYREGMLRIWQPDGTALAAPARMGTNIHAVIWQPDNALVALSNADRRIQLWNPTTQTVVATLTGYAANVRDMDFDAAGDWLATGDEEGIVKLWRMVDQTAAVTLSGHTDQIWDVSFAPAATASFFEMPLLASASADKTIRLWSLEGQAVSTLDKHTAAVLDLTFSPDGRSLFSASSDQTIIRWNLPEVLALDPPVYACRWVEDYLTTNTEVDGTIRQICDWERRG